MTLILAVLKDGIGYMAGDKCATQGNGERIAANQKVFNKNGLLLGFCGSWRLINAVANDLDVREILTKANPATGVEGIAFALANKLMELAFEYKFLTKEEDQYSLPDESECLAIIKNKIVRIHSDFSYIIMEDDFAAIGVPEHAEGVLSTLRSNGHADTLIKRAFKETARLTSGVSHDFVVLTEPQKIKKVSNESS